jgi:hypothetical protein
MCQFLYTQTKAIKWQPFNNNTPELRHSEAQNSHKLLLFLCRFVTGVYVKLYAL